MVDTACTMFDGRGEGSRQSTGEARPRHTLLTDMAGVRKAALRLVSQEDMGKGYPLSEGDQPVCLKIGVPASGWRVFGIIMYLRT